MAKQKPQPNPESELEGLFPAKGLDVSCEFGRQPPATAPEGLNVRSYEPGQRRMRGGSRPGLERYIDAQPAGEFLIQHLTTIVTTGEVALLAGVTPPGEFVPFILDPSTGIRNPGRLVPIGGSGVQPNRNIPDDTPDDDDDEETKNWFVGTIVTSGSTYQVNIGGQTRPANAISGSEFPAGTAVLLLKIDGQYYFQPPLFV